MGVYKDIAVADGLCKSCYHFQHNQTGSTRCNRIKRLGTQSLEISHCSYYVGYRKPIDVLIVTAVDVEYNMVLDRLLPQGRKAWQDVEYYPQQYCKIGVYESPTNKDISARLALVKQSRMGMLSAMYSTTLGIRQMRPTHIVMPGIMAGRRGRADIGDVIVANHVIDYETGKWCETALSTLNAGRPVFESRALPISISPEVTKAVDNIRNNLSSFETSWSKSQFRNQINDNKTPNIRTGAVVSGGSVINADAVWQFIEDNLKPTNLLGLEMEGYAVAYAAQLETGPLYRPLVLIAKAVCDYGVKKDDDNQKLAAFTSVEFLREYIKQYVLDFMGTRSPVHSSWMSTTSQFYPTILNE